MRLDFVNHHLMHRGTASGDSTGLSRREAMKRMGAAGAAAAVGSGLFAEGVGASEDPIPVEKSGSASADHRRTAYDDTMFDVDAVLAGGWVPSLYGAGDQRGSFNELTPERTAAAMRMLDQSKPVTTYQLGEEMYNGFPAFPSDPPRLHDMYLYVLGYEAPPGFTDGGGIQSGVDPIGPNLVTVHEERFAENFTFQIATQVDGLNHVGVGPMFYNGFTGPDMATPTGTTALGNETMGPVATRGVILDIVGLKQDQGHSEVLFQASNGHWVLDGNYRITVDDIEKALHRQHIWKGIGPGDVPILHTGWTHVKDDPNLYLSLEPGIYLAEARYFADRRVALIATDTWGLEVLDPEVTGGNAFPCHQELFVKNGIRIGESFVTDAPLADNCFEGLLVVTPENVPGATCGSSPPTLLGQPGRSPHLH